MLFQCLQLILLNCIGGDNYKFTYSTIYEYLIEDCYLEDFEDTNIEAWRNISASGQFGHHIYDDAVTGVMTKIIDKLKMDFPVNIPDSEIRDAIKNLQDCLKDIITSNPTLIMDDLASEIIEGC